MSVPLWMSQFPVDLATGLMKAFGINEGESFREIFARILDKWRALLRDRDAARANLLIAIRRGNEMHRRAQRAEATIAKRDAEIAALIGRVDEMRRARNRAWKGYENRNKIIAAVSDVLHDAGFYIQMRARPGKPLQGRLMVRLSNKEARKTQPAKQEEIISAINDDFSRLGERPLSAIEVPYAVRAWRRAEQFHGIPEVAIEEGIGIPVDVFEAAASLAAASLPPSADGDATQEAAYHPV